MRRTVPPSAEIEARIEQLLSVGVGENPRESLSQLARLGARLIIQRAVEDEFDAWLGRARYERRAPDRREELARRAGCATGSDPGRCRPPRGSSRSRSRRFARRRRRSRPSCCRGPRSCCGPEPLKALVIGAFVRGLSMRDVESLCEQAGSGSCLRRRRRGSARSSRNALTRSSGATSTRSGWSRCSSMRRSSPSGRAGRRGRAGCVGVHRGRRARAAVRSLGMRESFEDWQSFGRDLISRGLGAPMLIVADGAPGLTKAIEQSWPASDRQRCCVHRARNLYSKLPDRERERVKHAYRQALRP